MSSIRFQLTAYSIITTLFILFGFHSYFLFSKNVNFTSCMAFYAVLFFSLILSVFLNSGLFLISKIIRFIKKPIIQIISYLIIFIVFLLWLIFVNFYLANYFKLDFFSFNKIFINNSFVSVFECSSIILFLKAISI